VTYRPSPRDLRASDVDRERVITLLSDAAADGRLTSEEHADRVGRAHQARTLGELVVLTEDLAEPSAQPIRLDGRKGVAGVFGRDARGGRWVVPASLPVIALFGEVELDLRDALLQSGRTIIYATVVAGTLHLIVPDGVAVEMSGTSVLSRRINRTARMPGYGARPGDPADRERTVIEVRTVAVAGTVKVTAPKRQGWLGALRRGSLPRGSFPP
jgi:Domain of unknown function (DUF1707)/Cell wall-active antibiotics response 4TMS YvqF